MERTITMAAVKTAVEEAYKKYKDYSAPGASPDPRVGNVYDGKLGISVRLTDGRRFDIGDTDSLFPLGAMMRIPVMLQILTQMSVDDFVKKMSVGKCPAGCDGEDRGMKPKGVHAKNLRMISLAQPQGDPDGKMEILSDLMISLMGSSPVLDDKIYESELRHNSEIGVENLLASAGFELYDSTEAVINVAAKLHSMLVTTKQLSLMGATIAADGFNPETKVPVYDGSISKSIVAMMAAKGPKKIKKPWLVTTGVPAMTSFGGGMLAIIPGFGSIAVFAPELIDGKIAFKSAMTMKKIVNLLDLNVFASSKIRVSE